MADDKTPPELEALKSLCNTLDLEDSTDDLADGEGLSAWVRDRALAPPGDVFSDADAERVRDFREALRKLLLHNNGYDLDPTAIATLEAARQDAELVVAFDPDGKARLEPSRGGVDGVLGRLLGRIVEAQANGTWRRLKACPWHTCGFAFYDHSRNQSRTWCDMAVCGNRAKARSYRERARA